MEKYLREKRRDGGEGKEASDQFREVKEGGGSYNSMREKQRISREERGSKISRREKGKGKKKPLEFLESWEGKGKVLNRAY